MQSETSVHKPNWVVESFRIKCPSRSVPGEQLPFLHRTLTFQFNVINLFTLAPC